MNSYLITKEIIENIKYCKALCNDIKILDINTNKNYKLIKIKKNKINKINNENNKLINKINKLLKNELLVNEYYIISEYIKIINIYNAHMKEYIKTSHNILAQYDDETNNSHKIIASEIIIGIITAISFLNGIELVRFFILVFCFTCTYIIYRNSFNNI